MRNKGFTLIELLVVIAIIGILLSVVLSAVKKSDQELTDENFCKEKARYMSVASLPALCKKFYE